MPLTLSIVQSKHCSCQPLQPRHKRGKCSEKVSLQPFSRNLLSSPFLRKAPTRSRQLESQSRQTGQHGVSCLVGAPALPTANSLPNCTRIHTAFWVCWGRFACWETRWKHALFVESWERGWGNYVLVSFSSSSWQPVPKLRVSHWYRLVLSVLEQNLSMKALFLIFCAQRDNYNLWL